MQHAPLRSDVVVITGASAGVGRAIAARFAAAGARLVLIARGEERLHQVVEEIVRAGGCATAVVGDVADPKTHECAAAEAEKRYGRIDIWINSAMATIFAPVTKIEPDEFKRATEVTYLGLVYGTLAALKRMRPRNEGVILQIGSALAFRSIPLQAPYCAAKHAAEGFTDSLRSELMHENCAVRLAVLHLPAVNTPQFDWARNKTGRRARPVPPIYQPEVAAEAAYYLAYHPRRSYWLGWATVKAIVAQKFIPGLLDRYLAQAAYKQLGPEPQQLSEGNLFASIPGPFGAHGRFDSQARSSSLLLYLSKNRAVALVLALIAGNAVVLVALFV